jgi:hypothetical protein
MEWKEKAINFYLSLCDSDDNVDEIEGIEENI